MQKGMDGGGQDRRISGRDSGSHPKRTVRTVSQEEVVTAVHNQCWQEIMEGITKHGSAKRSIEILERDKEQMLKTLWGKLDFFFSRQELVDEM
jgi:L-rhamnose mutarotase